jgi:hypothetical protein
MYFRLALLPVLLLPLSLATSEEDASPVEPPVVVSDTCARCHSNAEGARAMRDEAGAAISPHQLWKSTMMANAARDPLWRAVLSSEIAATPAAKAEIEETCLRCHAPMADEVGLDDHKTGSLTHVLECKSSLGDLARDGVSCTICHTTLPDNLGTEESYSGGFELDPERRIFGPHAGVFTRPMRMMVGFTPTYSSHIKSSELCATCHTLETEALDAEGHAVGSTLVEQAPYLEWLNSDFSGQGEATETSCQDCHMPTSDVRGEELATPIARHPRGVDFRLLEPRAPFGRHVLVGGNTLVLGMLRDHAEELGVTAPAAAFDATIAETRAQLGERTARLAIGKLERSGDRLDFAVGVENLTGHKFPSAHPIRRAWLRVVVRDETGTVLFASGRTNEEGRIVDGTGKLLPSEVVGGPIEPHHDRITSSTEVATFESKMGDAKGQPTHLLIRGASYLKDDRLLPRGWSASHDEAPRTWPVGCEHDTNFVGGHDRVTYSVDLTDRKITGTLYVEAALLYQALGGRWAAELLRYDTPEVKRFARFYAQADRTPEVVATAKR